MDIWKDIQHHLLLEKWKLNLQFDNNLTSTKISIVNKADDSQSGWEYGKTETNILLLDGNVKWCSH